MATTPSATAEHEHGHPNIVLATLALASFMSVMDLFIVNVALHTIGAHLHHSLSDVAWVLNAYALFFGALLVPAGRFSDRRQSRLCRLHNSPWSQLSGGRLLLRQELHKLRTAVGSLLVGTISISLAIARAWARRQLRISSDPEASSATNPRSSATALMRRRHGACLQSDSVTANGPRLVDCRSPIVDRKRRRPPPAGVLDFVQSAMTCQPNSS